MILDSSSTLNKPKVDRHFESYEEMIYVIRDLIKKRKLKDLINSDSNSSASIRVSSSNLTQAIVDSCDIAVQRSQNMIDQLYIYNPKSKLMTSNRAFFEQIASDLSSHINFDGTEIISQLVIDDIDKIVSQSTKKLSRLSIVRDFIPITNNYLVMKNDQVLKLDTNELIDIKDIQKDFDIFSKSSIQLVDKKALSSEDQTSVMLYENIINRIMNDWSNGDPEVEHLLWEIIYSVIQNDNHNKFIVLKGPGGNGKSSYMKLLSKISSESLTQYANIHQFGDPNAINRLDMSTRLIVGDDAATNHKISDVALSNLKSIVTGDPISLPVKYGENIVVRTNALFIQSTNSDLSFFENNPAVKSRALVIHWTTTDYRSERPADITFNLEALLENSLFIDTWATMCLNKISSLDEFTIPQVVKDSTNEMIESNDTIKQFLDDIYSQVDTFEYLPIKLMYDAYSKWIKENNPKGGVMKLQTFTKLIEQHSKSFGFKLSHNEDRKKFKVYGSITSLLRILNVQDSNLDRQRYLKPSKSLTKSQLEKFDYSKLSLSEDELTDRDIQILTRLAFDHQNSEVISRFGSII